MVRIISFILLTFLAGSQNAHAENVTFTFAYDVQEGFPSFMGNGRTIPADAPGTYIEVLRLVEQRLPIKLKLVRYPWGRCKANIKANKVDAINSSFREARKEIGVFPTSVDQTIDNSKRITSDTYWIYAHEDDPIYFDPHSMKIHNIGKGLVAPLGYSIVKDLIQVGIPIQENPQGVLGSLKMVALNRASGAIAHETQAQYLLRKNPKEFAGIKPVPPAIKEKPYFILVSKAFYKKHPKLTQDIWAEIENIRENEFDKIKEKYYQ